MDALALFIEKSQQLLSSGEDTFSKNLLGLSQSEVPQSLYGERQKLYGADHRLILYSWFIESICDFDRLNSNTTKGRLWAWVKAGLEAKFPSSTIETEFITLITNEVYGKFVENRDIKRSSYWKISICRELIAREKDPKCWICQRHFCEDAIHNFTNRGDSRNINLPGTVDFMFPRGLIQRDLSIEVEHIVPFSLAEGNPDKLSNLALSCGWCNISKSNTVSVYTVNRNGKYYAHPRLGKRSVPNRYWIVKLLMLHRKCEVCNKAPLTKANKLRLDLINDKGVANISNLKVVCGICDRIKGDRLVSSANYKELISRKKLNLI